MPEPVNYNDRVLVVGPTGSGKTVLAQRLATSMTGARIRVVDPKGRLRLGVEPVNAIAAIDWSAPVAHFIPGVYDRAMYEELYEALFYAGGPSVIWTDETGGVGPTKAGYAPRGLTAIQAQGRELGIGHIACAQRPVNIATELRSEAEHFFIFGPLNRLDREALAQEIGTLSGDELGELQRELAMEEGIGPRNQHTFLWWDRASGDLAPCAPLAG